MKARILKKLLNNTRYNVNNNKEYIAVGSPLCHDLFSVNKKTLELKYALDTGNKGREELLKRDNEELLFIWDKLQELIGNGQIKDIIDGRDEIENPLPVFTVDDGELIETFTDAYGWPNTTAEGDLMYDNTYFKTKAEAVEYGIRDCSYAVQSYERRRDELTEQLSNTEKEINIYREKVSELRKIKKALADERKSL